MTDPLTELLWKDGEDRSMVWKIGEPFGSFTPKKAATNKYSDKAAYRAGYQAGFEKAKRLYLNRIAQLTADKESSMMIKRRKHIDLTVWALMQSFMLANSDNCKHCRKEVGL